MKTLCSPSVVSKILLLMLVGVLAGCVDVTYNIENPTTPPPQTNQFEVVRDTFDGYLSTVTATLTTTGNLFDSLNDGDTSNDPFVISVRSVEDYAKGHIPGAINIPWRTIADPTSLAKIPQDKQVVCYCYTGHTSAVATGVLNALGYNTLNMKFGFVDWTKDPVARATTPFSEETDAHDFALETTANTPPANQSLPTIDNTNSQDPDEIIRAAAEAYLDGNLAPVISAQALHDNLNDGDTSNDPFIISIRTASDYSKGHIPGAVNISSKEVLTEAKLKMIPPEADVVVYCYTGHTSGIVATALNMLGYKAMNLKYGTFSWTSDPDARNSTPWSEVTSNDFPFNTGPNP